MKMNKDHVFKEAKEKKVIIKYDPRGRYYVFISKSRLRDRIKFLFSGKSTYLYVPEEEFIRQGYICLNEYTYNYYKEMAELKDAIFNL